MGTPKQVVENVRKIRFGIGLDIRNLTEDIKAALDDKENILRDAAKLAKDIHTKKPHFIFELIQNAEDNEYDMDVIPKIKFILTSDCLIVQNNETGFKEENVWALCKIGGSTKRNKSLGYIGEKGIGFKSVFMVADGVKIFSNGFQFRFKYDKNDPLTMLIPEWIEHVPDFVDPTQTNIILILNDGSKARASRYLDDVHPNLLLFLRKLKIIEIEDRTRGVHKRFERFEKDNVVEIKIEEKVGKLNKASVLRWFVVKKLLTVPSKISEDKRRGVKETEIILAFPLKEEGSPDASKEQYVFAFLPIRKYGFKFIIQADFILPITREDIIKDNTWNPWLRDSLIKVFGNAITKFKQNGKLKYSFYLYIPLEEVKDEFFSPVVEGIYHNLKNRKCMITETGAWRKPSDVLIADEGLKEIIKNGDLYNFIGKEYLSDKIKVKKQVLHKLGIRDFLIDDLIEVLGNTEWLKKQSDEWFAGLYRYLSNKKLSEEQLENLRNLDIIRLENGELTSINKDTVFFPIEKERTYGFESELRIIRRDIISKYEKEERDKIFEFLKKLGIRHATPYEIIENHILPIYENGMWKEKDSDILMGHIMYIKYHLNKYYEESDRRLNGNRRLWEPKKDPLKRLKKSLLIRINKDDEGKKWYDNPENIYLPKSYGNENNLEELFKGIDVSFVHSCYLEQDIRHISNEIAELENKLEDKSKTWKKKHKKEVKKIKEQIKKLKNEKDEKTEEWRGFFLEIEVWKAIIVKKDPETEIYQGPYYADNEVTKKHVYRSEKQNSIWKNEEWEDTDWRGYYIEDDWISPHFCLLLEKLNKESPDNKMKLSGHILKLFDRDWDIYKERLKTKYYYRYSGQRGWSYDFTKSTFYIMLLENAWIPTTKGLHKPSEVFLDKPEIRELLGDTVPYLAVEIKNEEFIEVLGINTQANVRGVLNYLKALVEQKNTDKEKFEKLYEFLDTHFEEDASIIKKEFAENSLIFVPNAEEKYYSTKEVIWKDVSSIFGKNRVYLEKQYPKLKKFFVEKIGISEKPTPKDYADVLTDISKKDRISEEDKKIVVKIYEELNRNLNPDRVENPISQEDWWENFIRKPIFLTDKDEFWYNNKNIFINNDSELYGLFKDEEDISFLYLPEKYNPDRIKHFIEACGLSYISKSTKAKPLLEEGKYSKDPELTTRIQTLIPYVLRYLYRRENMIYEKLKKGGVFEKIRRIKVYTVEVLKVRYSISVDKWITVNKEAKRKCIYYNGHLYLKKNNGSIYDISVEFSKAFGEIKGLDDFVMNMISNISHAEDIMKAKKIEDLPDNEKEILKKIFRSENNKTRRGTGTEGELKGNMSEKQKEESEKDSFKEEAKGISLLTPIGATAQPPTESPRDQRATKTDEDVLDKTREEECAPKVSAEKVPLRIEGYIPKQEVKKEFDEAFGEKGHAIRISTNDTQPTEILSEESRKDIGREGEKYALYCILKEKMEEHFKIQIDNKVTFRDLLERYSDIILETDQGFKLRKNNEVIAEILWLNKNGESGRPYDIKIMENDGETFIEVKATSSTTKGTFQLSENEWRFMHEMGGRYLIYRVYGTGSEEAKAVKIKDPARLIKEGKLKVRSATLEL